MKIMHLTNVLLLAAAAASAQEIRTAIDSHKGTHEAWGKAVAGGDINDVVAFFADDAVIHWDPSFGPNSNFKRTYNCNSPADVKSWLLQIIDNFRITAFEFNYDFGMSEDKRTVVANHHHAVIGEKNNAYKPVLYQYYIRWTINADGKASEVWYTPYNIVKMDAASLWMRHMDNFASGVIADDHTDDFVLTVPPFDNYVPHPDGYLGEHRGNDGALKWAAVLGAAYQFEKMDYGVVGTSDDHKTAVTYLNMVIRYGHILRRVKQTVITTWNDDGKMTSGNMASPEVEYLNAAAVFTYGHGAWAQGRADITKSIFADNCVVTWPNALGNKWQAQLTGVFEGRDRVDFFIDQISKVKWSFVNSEILTSSPNRVVIIQTGRYTHDDGVTYDIQWVQDHTMDENRKLDTMAVGISSHGVYEG